MQVRAILTSIVLMAGLGAALPSTAQTSADQLILDMQQAARRGDKARLAGLLPQVRGHVLEPWAAYWEARSRLEDFTSADMQAFSAR